MSLVKDWQNIVDFFINNAGEEITIVFNDGRCARGVSGKELKFSQKTNKFTGFLTGITLWNSIDEMANKPGEKFPDWTVELDDIDYICGKDEKNKIKISNQKFPS